MCDIRPAARFCGALCTLRCSFLMCVPVCPGWRGSTGARSLTRGSGWGNRMPLAAAPPGPGRITQAPRVPAREAGTAPGRKGGDRQMFDNQQGDQDVEVAGARLRCGDDPGGDDPGGADPGGADPADGTAAMPAGVSGKLARLRELVAELAQQDWAALPAAVHDQAVRVIEDAEAGHAAIRGAVLSAAGTGPVCSWYGHQCLTSYLAAETRVTKPAAR